MNELTIDIITAEQSLLVGTKAAAITAPGAEGTFQVLPGHTTFLSALEPGPITVEGAEGEQRFAISGGFAEVMQDHIRILADQAVSPDAIKREQLDQAISAVDSELAETDPYAEMATELAKRRKFLEVQRTLLS